MVISLIDSSTQYVVVCEKSSSSMVVVVSTSRSENSTQRSQLFTQFAVVSAVFTSQSDIFSQWEIVKKFDLVQNNN